ncbi:MAG: ccr4 associated factor [Thelocarpon superellum]|nr:MAG: ccr4 associated factor [Thelocarpon superellum]
MSVFESPNRWTTCARCWARRHVVTRTPWTTYRASHGEAAIRRVTNTSSPLAPPTSPPSAGTAKLTHRRLISVKGQDAAHFLQGLTSNNIRADQTTATYACFLNAQGRVLNDVFIHPTAHVATFTPHLSSNVHVNSSSTDSGYLIEVDGNEASSLFTHLKRHKLRSRLALRLLDEEECAVWSVWRARGVGNDKGGEGWTSYAHPDLSGEQRNKGEIGGADVRAPGMGRRVVVAAGDPPPRTDAPETPLEMYHLRRILQGVPEGQGEIRRETALLQESNIDFMNGVDFRKGCYVGQELTIRTHHTGVVRKRILPVQLFPLPNADVSATSSPDPLPSSLTYSAAASLPLAPSLTNIHRVGDVKKRSTGKWLTGIGNVGLALCRLEAMTDVRPGEKSGRGGGEKGGRGGAWTPDHDFAMEWAEEEGLVAGKVGCKAFVPHWWPVPR